MSLNQAIIDAIDAEHIAGPDKRGLDLASIHDGAPGMKKPAGQGGLAFGREIVVRCERPAFRSAQRSPVLHFPGRFNRAGISPAENAVTQKAAEGMGQLEQQARDRQGAMAHHYAGQAVIAFIAGWSPVSVELQPPDFTTCILAYRDPIHVGADGRLAQETLLTAMKINRAALRSRLLFWSLLALTDEPVVSPFQGEHAAFQRLAYGMHPHSNESAYRSMIEVEIAVKEIMAGAVQIWMFAVAARLLAFKAVDDEAIDQLRPTQEVQPQQL